MDRHGIERRAHSEAATDGNVEPLKDESWLREQYCEREKSMSEIGDGLNLSTTAVVNWMDRHGIDRRSGAETLFDGDIILLRDKAWLREKYCEQGWTTYKMADELNVDRHSVARWLRRHDIEVNNRIRDPEHLSHRVRSQWEMKVATILTDVAADYGYESIRISYGDDGNRTYIPDFETDEYVIECKGRDWGVVFGRDHTDDDKARAAMRQLDGKEYVVIGIELPCDIHIPWRNLDQLRDLF
jgi:hypothetical protein